MIEKTLKTIDGSLRVLIPTILNEITLGQMIGMQEKHYLNDLDAISILSGIPKQDLNNVINFDDFSIFGEYDGSYSHDRGHIDSSDGEGYAVNSRGRTDGNLFMIGVRLFLNQQDLMTNDRTGARLEDFNPWTGKYSTMGQFDDGNGAY